MQSLRNLKVWEKAHALTLAVYAVTRMFPREEIYSLNSQMRRASSSIGANIAEGTCRKTDGDFGRFLQIAMGSASELEYHLLLARDLRILNVPEYDRLSSDTIEVKRMLTSLIRSLRS